ncbi:MAG: homoserine dehydrogenase [Actinomycetota bacterium]
MSITTEELHPPPTRPGREAEELGIALLGCGTVGSAVVRQLIERPERIGARLRRRPVLRAIAVRHLDKTRPDWVPRELLTADPLGAVDRDDVDVVVEVIGGVDPAGGLVELALARGKHIVTANKELLARRWACLGPAATGPRPRIRFEAAVMAGVPVVAPLAGLASSDRVLSLEAILNGTANYCLHRMEEDRLELAEVLEEAEELGFTEPDPTSDLDGRDAAAKLALLASLAFGRTVGIEDVVTSGIESVTSADLIAARARGSVLRLLAGAWRDGDGIVARVSPRWVPADHPLAAVGHHHNGLVVTTELAGALLFQGPGAGGDATASAILSDLVRAADVLESERSNA